MRGVVANPVLVALGVTAALGGGLWLWRARNAKPAQKTHRSPADRPDPRPTGSEWAKNNPLAAELPYKAAWEDRTPARSLA